MAEGGAPPFKQKEDASEGKDSSRAVPPEFQEELRQFSKRVELPGSDGTDPLGWIRKQINI